MSLNHTKIDKQHQGVYGDSLAVSASSLGIVQTYLSKSDSPWHAPIVQELNHAKMLAQEWRDHFYPKMFLDTLNEVVKCGQAFSNEKSHINQLFDQAKTNPKAKSELIIALKNLSSTVNGIANSYSNYKMELMNWEATMNEIHSKMELTIAKVQAQDATIKAEIATVNSEIANLKVQISQDQDAIRKAREDSTSSISETIFGFLLAPVTGGASLVLAGLGIANIVEGENKVNDMKNSISNHQNQINTYLGDLSADQAQCAALALLTIPSSMVISDLKQIEVPIENIRTDWASFSDEINGVITNILSATTSKEYAVQKLWFQVSCDSWSHIVTSTTKIINQASNKFTPPSQYSNLYYETDNGAVYLYMDGVLRHIPNPSTFNNLFDGPITPSAYVNFSSSVNPPLPIGTPIMEGASLVQSSSEGIFLQDQMPWNRSEIVLRHIVNPQQLTNLGFSTTNMLQPGVNPTHKGVPIALESKDNYAAAEALAGYYALYNHFIITAKLNPFFIYLLANYPNPHKDNYKALLKSQIIAAQKVVNNIISIGG